MLGSSALMAGNSETSDHLTRCKEDERLLRAQMRALNRQYTEDTRISAYDKEIEALETEIKQKQTRVEQLKQDQLCEGLDVFDASIKTKIDELKQHLSTANQFISVSNKKSAEGSNDFLALNTLLKMNDSIRSILAEYAVIVDNLEEDLRNAKPSGPSFNTDSLLGQNGKMESSHAQVFQSSFNSINSLAHQLKSKLSN